MRKLKIGVWQSVFCATLALLPYVLAILVNDPLVGLPKLATEVGLEILSGLFALYSSAFILGGYAGLRIERDWQNNRLQCFAVGIGLAVACLLSALLAGALVALLREAVTDGIEIAAGHAGLYLVGVPGYIMLFAVIPAAVLGILYTILVIVSARRNRSSGV